MISTFRLATRAVSLSLVTGGSFGLLCLGLPLAWLLRRRWHWRDRVMHWWARASLTVLRVRVQRRGPVPRGGCLLVGNHLSYLDVLVLASIRPLSFLAKSEVARWPLLGAMARIAGVRFIVRADRRDLPRVAAEQAAELAAGRGVTFFPEGTSSDGAQVLPFRPALLAGAAAEQRPVHWVALGYATPPGSPPAAESVCWWGDMTFLPHLAGLLRLPSVLATVDFGPAPIVADDRKELARALQAAIARGVGTVARVRHDGRPVTRDHTMRKHCLSFVSFLLLAACGGSDHNHPLAGNWAQDTGSEQKGITVEFEAGGDRCAVHGAPRADGGHDHPKATYTFDATSKVVTIKGEVLGAGKGDTWTGTLGTGVLELKSGDTVLKLKAGGASAH